MIKKYNRFVTENLDQNLEFEQFITVISDLPTDEILEFRDELQKLVSSNENLNENKIEDILNNIKHKFRKWLDDKIWKYLVNRKSDFYLNIINSLNVFDIYSLDDVFKTHPGFKIESLYLAGGMDKVADLGGGWRNEVEHEFESFPGFDTGLPEISLGSFGDIEPRRVVDGSYIVDFIKNSSKTKKLYNLPLVLNPIRKEVDRTKDVDFAVAAKKYKTFDYDTKPEEIEPTMKDIRKTMNRSIEVDDEHLVRLVDMVFLGLNTAAAAGTYGELQMSSFLNKPIFVWMTDEKWVLKDFSMWSFPHFSKFARSQDEMKILVDTIMNYIK